MSTRSLYQVAAAAIMAAAVLAAVGIPLVKPPPDVTVGAQVIVVGFWVLLLAGLPGVYLRQRRPAGVTGLIGMVIIGVSAAVLLGFNFAGAVIIPVLADGAPGLLQQFPDGPWARTLPVNAAGHVGFSLGWLVFGIATYRAHVLPRWAAAAATVGGVAQTAFAFVPAAVGVTIIIVMALGIFGLGWGLWTVADVDGGDVTSQRRRFAVASRPGSSTPSQKEWTDVPSRH